MPYKSNSELPKEIQALPAVAQTMFRAVFNKSIKLGHAEDKSFKIAWTSVKKRFEKKTDGGWVAKSSAFHPVTYYTFQAQKADEFVSRSEDGSTIHKYVLSDLFPDELGTRPSPELLEAFAEQAIGLEIDTDHELWNQALTKMSETSALLPKNKKSEDFIEGVMSHKKGIAKIIDAVVDAGKLVVSILFDKRYNKFIDAIKGLSIEAGVETNEETKEWENGKLYGATFAVNADPINPRATRFLA